MTIDAVRQGIQKRSNSSMRQLQQEVDFPYGTCKRILKDGLNSYPYRLQTALATERRRGPAQWPPSSPDLNLLSLFDGN